MSNVSTAHNVNIFTAGKSEALTGQRLAKVGYKTTKDNPARFPSICVSVPFIQESEILEKMERLIPAVRTMLESAQDGVIRSLYESSEGILTFVTDSDISIDACIAYLEAENQGTRLTKEFIGNWFDQNISESLYVVIAEKLGFVSADDENPVVNEDQDVVINKHLGGYKGLFESLAGGKTFLQPKQIAGLRKALEISAVSDDTSAKLQARLAGMEKRPIEEMLEL